MNLKQFIVAVVATTLSISCGDTKKDDNNNAENEKMSKTSISTEERNKKIIMESMAGVNAHNPEIMLKDAAADCTEYGDGSGAAMKGKDSTIAFVRMLFTAIPDYKVENPMIFASGNRVLSLGEWSGTFKNDLMGMKATGKFFKFNDVDVFTINDEGKITEHRSIYPMSALMMQGK